MTGSLTERYDDRIAGVLSCYDRVVVTGTLPTVCYAAGMTKFLYAIGVRIFDYPQFASTLRDRVRERAASLAAQAGITPERIAKSHIRKEAVGAGALNRRGKHPPLVHVRSAMEASGFHKPWHDKQTHKSFVRPNSGKCLHYYFYFIDAELGLVYLRVPTWAPFRLQFYCNGHSWLARQLTAEGIGFTAADNAFIRIDDWQRAQDLADRLSPDRLHLVLDRYAAQCCPVLDIFRQSYHWSLMQVEYATDLVFRSVGTLRPLYQHLARESVLSVKAEQIASFLGRQISPQLAQEIGSQFSTRIEGTCIKHRFARSSIKMYDKDRCVLRIEPTINAVSFFKHHRKSLPPRRRGWNIGRGRRRGFSGLLGNQQVYDAPDGSNPLRHTLAHGFRLTCMGLFLSSGCFGFTVSSLFGAGRRFFVPSPGDQVGGARGRGQGTETLAQLGGLPPGGAFVSQRLDA